MAAGVDFGTRYRAAGWGSGLTVLTGMANVLDWLDPEDRVLALVHGLAFVSRDTRGHAPRFALEPLPRRPAGRAAGQLVPPVRRHPQRRRRRAQPGQRGPDRARGRATWPPSWARRPPTTCSSTAATPSTSPTRRSRCWTTWAGSTPVRSCPPSPSRRRGRREPRRRAAWRHPYDLAGLLARAAADLPARLDGRSGPRTFAGDDDVDSLAWVILGDDPAEIVAALDRAVAAGATLEELARAVAYAAALRVTRFHTQNDHGDWDVVHHAFTAANAVHQLLQRSADAGAGPGRLPGRPQGVPRPVPQRARPPRCPAAIPPAVGASRTLEALQACWDQQDMVDEAGAIVYGWLASGGSRAAVLAALGSALLREDAEFHWFQMYEAAVRQSLAWPEGSEPVAPHPGRRRPASWPPTRRPAGSCPRWCASPPGCGGASPSTSWPPD